MSETMTPKEKRWEKYDERRKEIEQRLEDRGNIPGRVLRMNHVHTSMPKDGAVFDYPDSTYYHVGESLVPYREEIETVIREVVEIRDVWDISKKTDGRTDQIYWVINE